MDHIKKTVSKTLVSSTLTIVILILQTHAPIHSMQLNGNGVDINTVDSEGKTSLHRAVFENNKILVKFLICMGANVNKKDNNGFTPLDYTYLHSADYREIIKMLKDAGAIPTSFLHRIANAWREEVNAWKQQADSQSCCQQ